MLFLKLLISWLIIGLTCTVIATLYDIVVNRVYIGKRELKSMLFMIVFGVISVPLTVYFIIQDVMDNRKFKKKNKFR